MSEETDAERAYQDPEMTWVGTDKDGNVVRLKPESVCDAALAALRGRLDKKHKLWSEAEAEVKCLRDFLAARGLLASFDGLYKREEAGDE